MRHLHSTTPTQRRFYNDGLKNLDLPPVELGCLRVDRMGWSPEVAEALSARGCPLDYLRIGGIQFAIVVSPEQAKAPVLMPAHSFDSLCLGQFYQSARAQVANLTERGAVIVTMARGLDEARRARDLLHIESVAIEANDTLGLMAAARQQRVGAERIREDDDAVFDEGLLTKLVESASRFGDLRSEALDIAPVTFTDLRSFFTSGVAGGTWIFRDLPDDRVLTVVRQHEEGERGTAHYVSIDTNPECLQVLRRLVKAKFLAVPHDLYRKDRDAVLRVRRAILAAAVRDSDPTVKIEGVNEVGWGRLAQRLNGNLPPTYAALDRYAAALRSAGDDGLDDIVDDEELLPWLAKPVDSVSAGTRAALGSLLSAIAPADVLRQREYDRLGYRQSRKDWPEHYVAWVDEQISLAECA